jgi:hypothetical protein
LRSSIVLVVVLVVVVELVVELVVEPGEGAGSNGARGSWLQLLPEVTRPPPDGLAGVQSHRSQSPRAAFDLAVGWVARNPPIVRRPYGRWIPMSGG